MIIEFEGNKPEAEPEDPYFSWRYDTKQKQKQPVAFAAITTGGYVLFSFNARDTREARETVKSLRKRSDTITGVRKLRATDTGLFGGPVQQRGA